MSTRKNIDKIKKAILRNTRKKRKSLNLLLAGWTQVSQSIFSIKTNWI